MKKLIIALIMAVGLSGLAVAHSGGTNELGCHKDGRTGLWHCH